MTQTTVLKPRRQQRSPQLNWTRCCRYYYLRLIRQRGSAAAIARGLSAGVFAGLFPLFGLQTIIGIGIATICRGNKIIAAAATWVSNPLTYVPIFFFNFRVGLFTLRLLRVNRELPDLEAFRALISSPDNLAFQELLDLGGLVAGALFLGCFVVGSISAVVSYFGGLWLFKGLQERRYGKGI
ncbi:MAG: DUF2062 domain-containing protein [Cyanobacteria bacterium P01_F01_bin.150]